MAHDGEFRRELAQQLRVDSVRCSSEAGSGHPTSSMSAADLMAVLVDGHLRIDSGDLTHPGNDHLVFSKGHASPLYYALLKAIGVIDDRELLTFRRFASRLEGHPTPRIPPTDVATGSLGQGLPVGVGLAMTGRHLDRLPYRTWVLCGDSEMAEGSMWEAFQRAGWEGLDNLTVIVDVNRLGQTRETMLGWDMEGYRRRTEAFGWHAIVVDGHDLGAIDRAYHEAASTTGRPTVVLARTRKGAGVAAVDDQPGRHGKPLDDPEAAIAELGGPRQVSVSPPRPPDGRPHRFPVDGGTPPRYELGAEVPTRTAYGEALAALGAVRGDVVALDGEVSNSTRSEVFRHAHPDRYFEMFIAEQQMVAAAVGMQARGWTPFVSTFAAFLTRAADFVRMAAISGANLRLAGSHAGVSIGEDGPSQMGLEDLALFRALPGSTVLHPSDANQTVKLLAELADRPGIGYLRTMRGGTPVLTAPDEPVRIGGSRLAAGADATGTGAAAVIACGACVPEAVTAAEKLTADGTPTRVLDCYSVKPLDADAVRAAARDCGTVVTVEDHRPEGGLGEAVLAALADGGIRAPVRRLAVRDLPHSGTPAELRHAAGIDADAIVAAVHDR